MWVVTISNTTLVVYIVIIKQNNIIRVIIPLKIFIIHDGGCFYVLGKRFVKNKSMKYALIINLFVQILGKGVYVEPRGKMIHPIIFQKICITRVSFYRSRMMIVFRIYIYI